MSKDIKELVVVSAIGAIIWYFTTLFLDRFFRPKN